MDNNEEELEKQLKEQEANTKTAHVAGKAAATYLGGGVGGRIYDVASSTEVGKRIEQAAGSALQQNPLLNKASQKLNDSGALDVADKGLDMASGNQQNINSTSGLPPVEGLPSDEKSNKDKETSDNNSTLDNTNSSTSNDSGFSFFSPKAKKRLIIAVPLISFFLIFIIVIIAASSTLQPLMNASNYVKGLWNGLVDFLTTDKQELEEKFYKELQDTQKSINQEHNVCIDINLITATLTVYKTFDEFLEDGTCTLNCDINDDGYPDTNLDTDLDGKADTNIDIDENDNTYKQMTRQIKLLANMQMVTNVYELDNSSGSYCSETPGTEQVRSGEKNSSTPALIASHDFDMAFLNWFTSKTTEEQNNAYYIYKPPYDDENQCKYSYAKEQLKKMPENQKLLSIGDYETRMDSVYYWNIANSFIPYYYEEYLPTDEAERQKRIIEIADEIYLLYKQIGPSQTCSGNYGGPSVLCPNGVTVENQGTFELEEYVAGVVSNEAYSSEGIEALKAQAVAARTYVLNYTNYCTKVIPNSTNAQTFTRNVNDKAREATMSTAGEILTDQTGNIFEASYDSFCYQDSRCPDSKKNADGSYSVTYTKVPNGEQHVIILSDPAYYGWIVPDAGHAHGMSQLVSYQLAKEGYNYEQILKFFYSDGVSINLVLSANTTEGSTIISSRVTNYINVNEMNNYIYSNVRKAGVGTREGVVAAATSLISGIYTKSGYILPYELYPSGKYSGYGIDSNWGTNTGNANYPVNGLDCSGFISWAIHNGGYEYVVKSAEGWGNSGTKRKWSKGTTDTAAQPGDLIYNAPTSANGTTGHIKIIIGVTDQGYTVAEASSRKNGVRIATVPFTSTGNYYLVDMSSYYSSATKVSDYPG